MTSSCLYWRLMHPVSRKQPGIPNKPPDARGGLLNQLALLHLPTPRSHEQHQNQSRITQKLTFFSFSTAPIHSAHPHIVHLPTRRPPLVCRQLLPYGQLGPTIYGSLRCPARHVLGDWLVPLRHRMRKPYHLARYA